MNQFSPSKDTVSAVKVAIVAIYGHCVIGRWHWLVSELQRKEM